MTTSSCSTPAAATRRWRPRRSTPRSPARPLTTGFNPQFLLDGLTALDGEFIDLSFTQATKPVVISSTDAGADNGFRYLLMPRRLLS